MLLSVSISNKLEQKRLFFDENLFQIFVKSNFGGGDVTSLKTLALYGVPVNQTNMGEFKRVSHQF